MAKPGKQASAGHPEFKSRRNNDRIWGPEGVQWTRVRGTGTYFMPVPLVMDCMGRAEWIGFNGADRTLDLVRAAEVPRSAMEALLSRLTDEDEARQGDLGVTRWTASGEGTLLLFEEIH